MNSSNILSPTKQTPTKTPKKTPKKGAVDRFIPLRPNVSHLEEAHHSLVPSQFQAEEQPEQSKILAFKAKAPVASHKVLFRQAVGPTLPKKKSSTRYIPHTADRTLDAPSLKQDFYLSLVDWSCNNVVGVALGSRVFMWSPETAQISVLADSERDWTSVSWAQAGSYIALGTEDGVTEIHDSLACRPLRRMNLDCSQRVPVTHWSQTTPYLVASACDKHVIVSDVRIRDHQVMNLSNVHSQMVCGLRWSPEGNEIASGANDNTLCIWDVRNGAAQPKFVLREHSAAVKAISWCPWQRDLLASGGGTADRHIRFWNTSTGSQLNSIDTGSQVSSLVWSTNPACKELVSTHGFSNCEVALWKYPSLAKIGDLRGHQERILSSCLSPNGQTVCTAGSDETLRFWTVWAVDPEEKKKKKSTEKNVVLSTKLSSARLR